jgi:hypothetical protein
LNAFPELISELVDGFFCRASFEEGWIWTLKPPPKNEIDLNESLLWTSIKVAESNCNKDLTNLISK